MKSILFGVFAFCLTASIYAADIPVKVYVNNKLQSYSPPAVMRNATVYVPLRAGAESLGIDVKWHADIKTAQICTDSGCVMIRQKQGIMVNGSLLLPLRKMGEATKARMVWSAPEKAVYITK